MCRDRRLLTHERGIGGAGMTNIDNKKNKYYGAEQPTEKRKESVRVKTVSYYRDAKRKKRESEALFR